MITVTPKREQPAAEFPYLRFAHLDSSTSETTVDEIIRTYHYTLHPITVTRPPVGRLKTRIVCESCQKTVRCVVLSEHEERAWRKRRRVRRWTLLAVVAAGLAYSFGFSDFHPHVRGGVYWAWIVGVGLALPAFTPLILWVTRVYPSKADGIWLGWSRRHSLRPAGSTFEVVRRTIPEPPELNI